MATTDEIVVPLRADIIRLRKDLRNATKSVKKNTGDMNKSFKSVGNVVKTLGVTIAGVFAARALVKVGKSFIDAASEAEQFEVRLRVMLGSVEEGNQVFQDMTRFASQVPFEYREIMAAATQLATVLKGGSAEINKFMPLIADIAAATGLSIEQTAEQFTRAMSAGIGAADLFRERGVNSVLGFKAGAKVSVEETRAAFENALTDMDFKFKGTAKELGGTWSGLTSMLSDKWFQFRKEVTDDGVFDLLKKELFNLNESLSNDNRIVEAARAMSDAFFEVVDAIRLIDAFIEDITPEELDIFVEGAIQGYVDGFKEIGRWIGIASDEVLEHTEAMAGEESAIKRVREQIEKETQARQKARIERDKALQQAREQSKEQVSEKVVESIRAESEALQKFIENLEFEVSTQRLSNTEKQIAIALRKAEAIAQKENIELTEQEREQIRELVTAIEEYGDSAKSTFEQVTEFAKESSDQWAKGMADNLAQGKVSLKDWGDFFVNILEQITSKLIEVAFTKQLVDGAVGLITGGFGGFGGGAGGGASGGTGILNSGGSLSGGDFLSGFAEGGRPPVGRPSIVGEKGAEIFVPDIAGTIIPNSGLNNVVNFTQVIKVDSMSETVDEKLRIAAPIIAAQAQAGVKREIEKGGSLSKQVGRRR